MDLLSKDMLEAITAFMRTHALWGAPILFAIMLLEGVILTTFIFSGSLMVLAAGALIQAGVLEYTSCFLAIFTGFCLGDWINFEIGRKGEPWFRNLGMVKKRPAMMQKAETMITSYGVTAIFISRFLGPSRPFVTFLAGACHMRPKDFHMATAVATFVLTWGLLNAGITGVQLWDRLK
jgi:membrane protein DedA with SNARE-associated domain